MMTKFLAGTIMVQFSSILNAAPAINTARSTVTTVGSQQIINWAFGLFIVLSVFFLCIWLTRKVNKFSLNGSGKLRILGGLSLGMREKIVLVQLGRKQLLLGVSPGKIKTLDILEGEDCLHNKLADPSIESNKDFTHQLIRAIRG